MKTRNLITVLFLLLAQNLAFAQDNFLWPIPGKQAGDDILYRPQDYIGVADGVNQAELNFDHLISGAPLGTPVVCPVDGKSLTPALAIATVSVVPLMYLINKRATLSKIPCFSSNGTT